MTVNLNIVEKCVSCLDVKESYDLAKRMEQEKTNPVLGYRTAGSLAERKTGDMLLEEMKKAGLTQVEKDKIRVDAWEFKKAVMRCHDREDQGDRYPKSHRCRKRNHHAAVSDRGASGKFDGMPCGNRSFLGDPESGSCGDEEFHEFYHGYESGLAVCGIFCPDRCAFWSVSG